MGKYEPNQTVESLFFKQPAELFISEVDLVVMGADPPGVLGFPGEQLVRKRQVCNQRVDGSKVNLGANPDDSPAT